MGKFSYKLNPIYFLTEYKLILILILFKVKTCPRIFTIHNFTLVLDSQSIEIFFNFGLLTKSQSNLYLNSIKNLDILYEKPYLCCISFNHFNPELITFKRNYAKSNSMHFCSLVKKGHEIYNVAMQSIIIYQYCKVSQKLDCKSTEY